MAESPDQPWSDGPNAPQISYAVYTQEKGYFAGSVIATIFYGIVVALFFQCMSALLYPVHPTMKGIRWGLVAHTVAMFSFSTIGIAINRDVFSISYINDREFTGPILGPVGFLTFTFPIQQVIGYVAFLMFPFNQWLAGGLLLYRCLVIFSMSYWAIALPSLMYLASIVTGILWFYHGVRQDKSLPVYDTTYLSICVSLNVLITLMIIARLALHSRNIRNAIGASSGVGGLYTTIITMLVESSAIYAVGYLLYIGTNVAGSYTGFIFSPLLGEIQVITSFLIILRVANRTTLTSDAVISGNIGSIHFRSGGGSTGDYMGSSGETSDQFGVGSQDN